MILVPGQVYKLIHPGGDVEAVFKHTELNEIAIDTDFVFQDTNSGREYWIPVSAIASVRDEGEQSIYLVDEIPQL